MVDAVSGGTDGIRSRSRCVRGLALTWRDGLDYSRSATVQALPRPREWPQRLAPLPSVGGQLGGCPSGTGELAEVVAGKVEGPLDVGLDLAAEP